MKLNFRKFSIFLVGILCLSCSLHALSDNPPPEDKTDIADSSWTFVGVASNEENERYYYYFQLIQQARMRTVQVLLVDAQNKNKQEYFLKEEKSAPETLSSLQAGRAFLRFNAINNSWIFGLKNKNGEGFNFRVELLKQSEEADNEKDIAKGVHLEVTNIRRMNGHVRWGKNKKEEFVTADQNWYRNIVVQDAKVFHSTIQGVFCFLNDGARFYSVKLPLEKAKSASEIRWWDPEGKSRRVSQFLQQKVMDGKILLSLKVPAIRLTVEDLLWQPSPANILQAGFVSTADKSSGFCFIDQMDFNIS